MPETRRQLNTLLIMMKYALFTALLYILCRVAVATGYPQYHVPANMLEFLHYNQTEVDEAVKDMVEVDEDVLEIPIED